MFLDFGIMSVFMDFGIMSVLLVVAHLLRSRIKLLQNFFIPTAIIAGMLGLLGTQAWPVLPFSKAPSKVADADQLKPDNAASKAESDDLAKKREELPDDAAGKGKPDDLAMADYAFYLVVVLFATLFLGARKKSPSMKTVVRKVGDTFFYNLASEIGMFGFALGFGLLVMAALFPGLPSSFSLLLPAGFVGGHGTANVVGTTLEAAAGPAGLPGALTIGYTFATVGLLAGILGGMLLINIATRCGWTRMVRSAHELPESVRKGFLPKEEQRSMGRETVSPIALDSLTWHIALVLTAFAAAFFVEKGIKATIPGDYSIPLFAVSMLAGACLQKALGAVGLGVYVDRHVMERIGSSVSDYLIAFGVASIKIDVVLEFAVPIAILSVFGIVFAVALFWYIGRRIYHNFWFERSIFVYGWNTGVVAIGITLLRVVDPRLKTKTLEDFGLAYIFISVVEIVMLVTVPVLVVNGVILAPALVLIGGFFACIFLSRGIVGWFRQPAHQLRTDEEDIIGEAHQATGEAR